MTSRKLTLRQRRFIDEYLVDGNGTRAAIVAGYSENCAHVTAHDLLKDPKIISAIEEREAKRTRRLEMKADNIVKLIWDQATADPREFLEIYRGACRYCYGEGFQYQRKPEEYRQAFEQYTRGQKALAAKGQDADLIGINFPILGGVGYRSRRPPHPDCPECEGRGVEHSHVKDMRDLPDHVIPLLAGVETTKDGVKIKMNSQDKARELIGKHKGLFLDKADGEDEEPTPVAINFRGKDARKPS